MSYRYLFYLIALGCAAISTHVVATDARVSLATNWQAPLLKPRDTIVTTLVVNHAISGQKIRIQNSNHGASHFSVPFSTAVGIAVAEIPGVTFTKITEQQMEIELAAGSYVISIMQTVSEREIARDVDDASWIPGSQAQVDWLLSSSPSNGAMVEAGHTVVSKWIGNRENAQGHPGIFQGGPTDARWALLRSAPKLTPAESVTFEIHETNHALTAPASLRLRVDASSTASEADFVIGLEAAIAAARRDDVRYDGSTGKLTLGPKTVFPFRFTMMAGATRSGKDYILTISDSEIGQIDVAKAGVRLGHASPPIAPLPLLGVNEASGDFGVGSSRYAYPGNNRIDWAAAEGFGIIRVPFLFQNIQPASGADLDETAMRQLDPVMAGCARTKLICLLDMHNYGSYYRDDTATTQGLSEQGLPGTVGVSNARLAQLWAQIARRYKDNSSVWFGLMNEPNRQTALEWIKTANTIAAAIRATGATNKILFPGTAWDGAWSWNSSGNAAEMLKAYDPAGNFAFEAHQYLDSDGSGTSPTCVPGSGARLTPFTEWLRTYRLHGVIGEVGWAANADCQAEGAALLEAWRSATASADAGGYIALTYWANGPLWPDSYQYLAEPRPFPGGAEPAQLATLRRFLPR